MPAESFDVLHDGTNVVPSMHKVHGNQRLLPCEHFPFYWLGSRFVCEKLSP